METSNLKTLEAMVVPMELHQKMSSYYTMMDVPSNLGTNESNDEYEYDLYVVLDCSGSMGGLRIKLATQVLHTMMTSNKCISEMIITKFGSNVEAPKTFNKQNRDDILKINADCGGTNFRPPMNSLIKQLCSRNSLNGQSSKRCAAMFFSDGEADDPTELYSLLVDQLSKTQLTTCSRD